ncbi:MAG TPA: alcohol dehydrogenase catalytic domain-containing protein [Stellaceae bacterium]|nr:alcohol dehydrogenase catalytic domain-containing protein [Stellaceae bacterium]
MRAIVKNAGSVSLGIIENPRVEHDDDVVVRVQSAGLCRTDVFVADGVIRTRDPLVIGHEFSGVVEAVGAGVSRAKAGDRVAVFPVIACGACRECRAGRADLCQRTSMLGLESDGAFAELVKIPERAVFPMPDALPFRHGAYAEPVAASLAVLKSGIRPEEKGLVYGNNRIAELTLRILEAYDFADVQVMQPSSEAAGELADEFDFVIETLATTETLSDILEMTRPGGRIVLKSRRYQPVSLSVARCVKKEVTFSAVNYGDFGESVRLLAERRIEVDDLFGENYPMEAFDRMLEAGRSGESLKLFLEPR